jgi:hypothetical protein
MEPVKLQHGICELSLYGGGERDARTRCRRPI